MSVMQQKLVKDFFKADDVKSLIISKQLDLYPGVEIYKEFIQIVRDDIKTMDEEANKVLEEKNKNLNNRNNTKKKEIEQSYKQNLMTDPNIDKRNLLDYPLLQEDFKRYQEEQLFIQDLCYRKGWFD